MKTAYYDHDTRSIVDLLPPGELYPGWTISRVSVLARYRGQGVARRLMNQVIADADAEGVKLYLEVVPTRTGQGELNSDQLIAFYRSCGFLPSAKYGFPVMARNSKVKD